MKTTVFRDKRAMFYNRELHGPSVSSDKHEANPASSGGASTKQVGKKPITKGAMKGTSAGSIKSKSTHRMCNEPNVREPDDMLAPWATTQHKSCKITRRSENGSLQNRAVKDRDQHIILAGVPTEPAFCMNADQAPSDDVKSNALSYPIPGERRSSKHSNLPKKGDTEKGKQKVVKHQDPKELGAKRKKKKKKAVNPSTPARYEVMYKEGLEKMMSKPAEDMYLIRKEQKELEECTFRPKISKASQQLFARRFGPHITFFDRQEAWEEKRAYWIAVERAEKEAKDRAHIEEDLSECTFSPTITPVPAYLKKRRQRDKHGKSCPDIPWEPLPPSSLAQKTIPAWGSPPASRSPNPVKRLACADSSYCSPAKSYASACATPPKSAYAQKQPKELVSAMRSNSGNPTQGRCRSINEGIPEISTGQEFILHAGLKYIIDWERQNKEAAAQADDKLPKEMQLKGDVSNELRNLEHYYFGSDANEANKDQLQDDFQSILFPDEGFPKSHEVSDAFWANEDTIQEALKVSDLLAQYDIPLTSLSSRKSSEVTTCGSFGSDDANAASR